VNDPVGDSRTDSRSTAASKRASFDDLWADAAPRLYAWTVLHLRPAIRRRLDPEDVLQEVACRAYSQFSRFDPERGPFRAWVFGFARNVLQEALRRLTTMKGQVPGGSLSTGQLAELPASTTTLSRAVARDEGLAHFVTRLETLGEDERRLVVFHGLEGLSHNAVGELMQVAPDAIAKRWQRLCERLRDEPRWSELVA
jgi:RNA polymerase sigma factor (sigma-70 family)